MLDYALEALRLGSIFLACVGSPQSEINGQTILPIEGRSLMPMQCSRMFLGRLFWSSGIIVEYPPRFSF